MTCHRLVKAITTNHVLNRTLAQTWIINIEVVLFVTNRTAPWGVIWGYGVGASPPRLLSCFPQGPPPQQILKLSWVHTKLEYKVPMFNLYDMDALARANWWYSCKGQNVEVPTRNNLQTWMAKPQINEKIVETTTHSSSPLGAPEFQLLTCHAYQGEGNIYWRGIRVKSLPSPLLSGTPQSLACCRGEA